MSEQIFNTRIVHKHDTEANWNKAINFIPKAGELIIYDPDENYVYSRIKIGDGVTIVTNLPFIKAEAKNFVIPIEHSLDNDSNDVYTLGETYSYSDLIAAINDGNEISCRITSKQSRSVILLPLIEYNMRADHFKFSGLYNEQLITVTITNINDDVLVEYINPNVNADWNQTDENASDFIKNKPFYDINVSSIICDDKVDFERAFGGMDGLQRTLLEGIPDEGVPCKKGHIYNAIFNNENNEFVCQEVVCEQDGYLTMPVQDYDYYVEIAYGYKISIHTNSEYFDFDIFGEGVYNFTITEIETAFKTLDEKFIPDTIARVDDIPEINYPVTSVNGQTGDVQINIPEQVQSDWTQTDETATNYIKNKPILATSEEIKALFN